MKHEEEVSPQSEQKKEWHTPEITLGVIEISEVQSAGGASGDLGMGTSI
ncbi:hypothetical protein ACQZV8_02330 [Magnetococcales bacterium HHB-1]